jgi:hypothetical protein
MLVALDYCSLIISAQLGALQAVENLAHLIAKI